MNRPPSASDASEPTTPTETILTGDCLHAYLVEYQECMDSYRHTYQTLWQAGALFAAISAAIVSFGKASQESWIDVLAPIPFLFWYLGIFRPMNRYGELRNDRLAALEEVLSRGIPGLDMRHVRMFSSARKHESVWVRIVKLKWLWQPRVVEIVTIFGVSVLVLEVYLLWKRIVVPPVRSFLDL